MHEQTIGQAEVTGPALENWLAEFRRARTSVPEFYYNEIAERGRASGRLGHVIKNFLSNQLSLADFREQVRREGNQEKRAARGRGAGHYWRFNGAGRLFLDSFFKAAERARLLNAADQALQAALTVPASLDRVGQQFENFEFFLNGLKASGVTTGSALSRGHLPYILSYFWAIQQPEWPIYGREIRDELAHLGLYSLKNEPKSTRSPGTAYTSFYLAFSRLASQLRLSAWELESFLHWLARRDFSPAHLRPTLSDKRKLATGNLGKLREALEPRLQTEIAPTLHGTVLSQERLIFQEIECPLHLELRLGEGQILSGVGFEGFSPALLSSAAGDNLPSALQGFLSARPGYHLYDHTFNPAEHVAENLTDEFWLLRSLEVSANRKNTHPDLPETLLTEWPSLYHFARRLIAPFDDIPTPDLPDSATFSYESIPAEEDGLRVAEPVSSYILEPDLAVLGDADNSDLSTGRLPETQLTQDSAATLPVAEQLETPNSELEIRNSELKAQQEAEVRRLDHLVPAPLTTEQLEGLLAFIRERLVVPAEKVREVLTHLEAGRNVLLYGPPGSGKTRLARLLAGQLCALDPGWTPENTATNYSLATAGPEWSSYEVIGGIRPSLLSETSGRESERLAYYFEPGVVARAALECERSLARSTRPHYLIIDEFNRANQERAFGELFTVLEYRDQPLLPGARLGRLANLYLPDAFRIIGTMNSDDRNTLFELGLALRRRFALVELDLPPAAEERRFLPKAVQARLPDLKLTTSGEFAEPALQHALDQLMTFAAAVRPDPANPNTGGKKLGTAPLIEALLFCAVATRFYEEPDESLEDAIMADILPQLERAPQAIKRALALVSPSGALSELARVRAVLQRMSGTNTYF